MASSAVAPVAGAAESALEARLLADAAVIAGLRWGVPRPGHPEGRVAEHVAAMLRRIPRDDPCRAELRVLALVHDAAKAAVRHDRPWSPDNDHAVLARRLAEAHTDDERLLTIIELHDEPYWQWLHDAPGRVLRDGAVVRAALRRHRVLGEARAVQARLYRLSPGPTAP